MSKHTPTLAAGYDDGSGQEYIIQGQKPVLTLRWGCSCCKDTSPLREEEIAFRNRIVRAVNAHDVLIEALTEARQGYGDHHPVVEKITKALRAAGVEP